MLDAIAKQEYIDNSTVFFDFLMHTRQWSNISNLEYKRWLSNFESIQDGEYIACRLLNHLLYYSEKDIKKLIIDSIDSIFCQEIVLPLQLSKGFSSLPSENEYAITEALKRTLFIPLSLWDNPGDSGPHVIRLIHDYYKPQVQTRRVTDIDDTMCEVYDRIIIVDDFVGSGEQFSDFWAEAQIKNGTLLQGWCVSHKMPTYYLALIGCEKTLQTLREECKGITIQFAETLSDNHRVFSDDSFCWNDCEEKRQVRQILEQELGKFGIKLLGYKDLDFAVATHDTMPDWSLPLFHKNIGGWKLLVERKDSNE